MQATIECGFTLKRERDMTATYSQLKDIQMLTWLQTATSKIPSKLQRRHKEILQ